MPTYKGAGKLQISLPIKRIAKDILIKEKVGFAIDTP